MGLLDLITNTVEGVAQVAINTVKLPVAVIVDTSGETSATSDAADRIFDGIDKIGDAKARDHG